MVCSYLEKLQNEYLEEKINIEKRLTSLQIRLKENMEFIKLLEENSDPNYASFTPREVHSKNTEKIAELKDEQKKIIEELEEVKQLHQESVEKLDELNSVLKVAKSSMISKDEDERKIDEDIYRLKLLETQENERQRISRELHDSTVQGLTSLGHMSELCS